MAHFAEIDENNIVVRVLVVDDNNAANGQEYLANELGLGGTWLQTSYNTSQNQHPNGKPLRGNYAGLGFLYNQELDIFIAPKPFASWSIDETTATWVAPIAMPSEGAWEWDENSQEWVELIPPTE